MFENIDFLGGKQLRKSEFRNCMMHFGLKSAKGVALIHKDKINLGLPFCGLTESQFNMTYEEVKNKIEKQLDNIYQALGFDLLLSDDN